MANYDLKTWTQENGDVYHFRDDSLVTQLLSKVYPVGSIYMSVNSTNPGTFLGGTWQRITGRFLLAATDGGSSGASQAPGNTGGSATVTLSTANLPAHTHGSKSLWGRVRFRKVGTGFRIFSGVAGIMSDWNEEQADPSNYETVTQYSSTQYRSQELQIDATHTHDSVGSGTAHENMPPYLSVYVWKRTA